MDISRHGIGERMSKYVIYNNCIHLSGQVAADRTAAIDEQTRSVLARIDGLLAEAGSDKSRIISATIYLKDIAAHFGNMNKIWIDWLPEGAAPARATVQAQLADETLLIEISIVAAVGN